MVKTSTPISKAFFIFPEGLAVFAETTKIVVLEETDVAIFPPRATTSFSSASSRNPVNTTYIPLILSLIIIFSSKEPNIFKAITNLSAHSILSTIFCVVLSEKP